MNAGVSWQLRQPDKIGDNALEIRKTRTNLNLGLAYAVSQRNNLSINVRTNISGNEGSMTNQEMAETEGEAVPLLVREDIRTVGTATYDAAVYAAINYSSTGEVDWKGTAITFEASLARNPVIKAISKAFD